MRLSTYHVTTSPLPLLLEKKRNLGELLHKSLSPQEPRSFIETVEMPQKHSKLTQNLWCSTCSLNLRNHPAAAVVFSVLASCPPFIKWSLIKLEKTVLVLLSKIFFFFSSFVFQTVLAGWGTEASRLEPLSSLNPYSTRTKCSEIQNSYDKGCRCIVLCSQMCSSF